VSSAPPPGRVHHGSRWRATATTPLPEHLNPGQQRDHIPDQDHRSTSITPAAASSTFTRGALRFSAALASFSSCLRSCSGVRFSFISSLRFCKASWRCSCVALNSRSETSFRLRWARNSACNSSMHAQTNSEARHSRLPSKTKLPGHFA